MIIPVKCFTCNRLIANKYEKYLEVKEKNPEKVQEFFKQSRIKRNCCKRLFLTHVDIISKLN